MKFPTSQKRNLLLLSTVALFLASVAVYTQQRTYPQAELPYPPAAVRVANGKKLPPEQFIGSLTVQENERIINESKTKGFTSAETIGAQVCAECHQDVVAQWATSAHRFSSFNNPFYEASVMSLRKEEQGKTRSRWCASCHDPALLFTGDFDDDFDRNGPQAQAGLTCLACHGIRDVAGRPGNGNYVMGTGLLGVGDPLLELDGKKRVTDPVAVRLHKQNVLTRNHQTAEFCGACHKASLPAEVNNYQWFRAQNDYDPWHDSGASGNAARSFFPSEKRRICQDCHMPHEKATLGDLAAKNGLVRSHRFLGINTALPAIRNDQATLELINQFLSNRLSIDLFAMRRGKEFGTYIPALDVTRPVLVAGEEIEVDVVLRNRDVGHTFPGGTLDLNEGWVELSLMDINGKTLAINGDLKNDGELDPQAHAYRSILLDESEKPIIRHDVAHVRTLLWRHVIPFGEADVVRYRFTVPRGLKNRYLLIRGRLLWRKFNKRFTRFSQEEIPAGFPAGDLKLPVIELARSEISLRVSEQAIRNTAINLAAIKPTQWSRFNDYGIGALLQRDFETAKYAFLSAQRIAPDEAGSFLNYARTMIDAGDTDEGLKRLGQISSRLKDDPRLSWSIANAYFMRRNYPMAASRLWDVLKSHPEDRQSWLMLAQSLANQGAYAESLAPLDKLLAIDPANELGHQIRSRVLEELNRNAESKQSFIAYEKYKDDYFAWNRRWRYREEHPIDHREASLIHWHALSVVRPEISPKIASPKTPRIAGHH